MTALAMLALIPLTNGGDALVDAADATRVSTRRWFRDRYGYIVSTTRVRRNDGRRITLHRFLLEPPDGLDVDHRNHDRSDNRRANLRVATRSQNIGNARRHRDSRSPFKGVTWRKDVSRWTARIMVQGKEHHLGCFDAPEKAAAAYAHAADRLRGEFACVE